MNTASNYLKEEFTRREIEIMSLVSIGMSSKEIAGELYISKNTVDTHRRNIVRKKKNNRPIIKVGSYALLFSR